MQTTNFTETGQKIIVHWQENLMPKKIEVIQPRADDIVEMAVNKPIYHHRGIEIENKPIVVSF